MWATTYSEIRTNGHIKIIPLKYSFSRRKPYVQKKFIEHTNAYFKCNKILNFLMSISFKFRTTFFSYYTPILMTKQSRVHLFIIKLIAIIQGPTTTWVYRWFNRSNSKHCVLHNSMITWNSLPDVFKVNSSFSMCKSKVRNFDLEKY